MADDGLRGDIRKQAPNLAHGIGRLCEGWLAPLITPSAARRKGTEFRPKQINDAIWGTVELHPWEVALIDTPLLQRMRGVRQLGLAHLVFPGAVHDRLEHTIGVVGAVELMLNTIGHQIERWNREPDNRSRPLPRIEPEDRYRLRLAAIFHDLGHGPFSHAIEPVMEVTSPLGAVPEAAGEAADTGWRHEIETVRRILKQYYLLSGTPAASEIMAVMIVFSDAMTRLLSVDWPFRWDKGPDLQNRLVACIIGAIEGPGADHLSAVISSQLDADRTDYLSRDAHHSGLSIGFDTDRLLSRLEILQMREDNTPGADDAVRTRIADHAPNPVLQIGIASSGFGSFEQMLIGRTFLYDRLYHHHKVRAAEAMAQRMLLVAERDRGRRLELDEIFLSVGDDTLVRIIAEEVTHRRFETRSDPASRLAQDLLNRRLLHRAFAFRARFTAMPPGLKAEDAETTRNAQWRRLLKSLETLAQRYELGVAIYEVAERIVRCLIDADVEHNAMEDYAEALAAIGPDGIIVDLPQRKADAIRILARYPDGKLKVPEFSFNPVKWADAYDLQKRTGYVFCPKDVVPVVALASAIVFLARFGIVMGSDADGYIKASQTVAPAWMAPLVKAGILDETAADLLQIKRYSLLTIRPEDLRVPAGWLTVRPHFAEELSVKVKQGLRSGLTAESLTAFRTVMEAMFVFMDLWYGGPMVVDTVADEADLQERLRRHLVSRSLKVVEGTVVGGGKLDLFVEDTVLIENKFKGTATADPMKAAPAAGAQGRRYAVALLSQVVLSVAAVKVPKGAPVQERTKMVEVRQPNADDDNRVEIRFTVPFGAVVPSAESAPAA